MNKRIQPSGLDQQGRHQTRTRAADPFWQATDFDQPTVLPEDTDGFGFRPAEPNTMPRWVRRTHRALNSKPTRSYPPVRTPGLLIVAAVYVGALAVVGWRLLVGGI